MWRNKLITATVISTGVLSYQYVLPWAYSQLRLSEKVERYLPVSYPPASNVEDALARGQVVSLHCFDQVSIELLPGVSTTLAARLLALQSENPGNSLKSLQSTNSREYTQKSLESIHGIGRKKSTELARYIDVDTSCPDGSVDKELIAG